ncbi:MAG TPA: hypothetical protein VHA75_01095, partial [Rugosimonospora sp.]|nr:hypothetical protein [Rugosimonospora sp.]
GGVMSNAPSSWDLYAERVLVVVAAIEATGLAAGQAAITAAEEMVIFLRDHGWVVRIQEAGLEPEVDTSA